MLAKPNRLTRGSEYKTVVRRGVRCAGVHTVTYVADLGVSEHPRFGFIVSKQIGSAVTRNRVRRRLKAMCAETLPQLRPGADIVIRALPGAAEAEFATLRDEVVRSLRRRAQA